MACCKQAAHPPHGFAPSLTPGRPRFGGSGLTPFAITTSSLSKTYRPLLGRGTPSVSELDLEVPQGTVFGLLGPNGAGKTTTILMLLGIVRPSHGTFSLFGEPMRSVKVRKRVGYLPEKFQLPGFLKAQEFLRFHGRLCGLGGSPLERRIELLLRQVGLGDRGQTSISAFSKGMQQRLAMAQALIHDPDLVVLDEPTSALDPVGRMEVRDLIEQLKGRGKTILLNSHILSDVERVCDQVAILRRGRLERQGPIGALTDPRIQVRLRVAGYNPDLGRALGSLGRDLQVATPGEIAEITLDVPDEALLPGLAEAVHAAGGRLYALIPARESLEDLFMRIMKEQR